MKKSNIIYCFTLIVLLLIKCGSNTQNPEDQNSVFDRRQDRLKTKHYLNQGENLYKTYCTSCHQSDGKGLAKLYPPLANSDYLMEDIPRAACIIKYGKYDEIVVNGVSYSQLMPSLTHLTNLEIAEILTYITNTWENKSGIQHVSDVERWINECTSD